MLVFQVYGKKQKNNYTKAVECLVNLIYPEILLSGLASSHIWAELK